MVVGQSLLFQLPTASMELEAMESIRTTSTFMMHRVDSPVRYVATRPNQSFEADGFAAAQFQR